MWVEHWTLEDEPALSRTQTPTRAKDARSGIDWGEVVGRLHGRVFGIALRLMRNEQDALDAAQETFFRAMRAADKIDLSRPMFPWLARIVSNICIDSLRRRGVLHFDGAEKLAQVSSAARRPDQILSAVADAEKVRRCVDQLPDTYRAVVVLKYQAGLSNREISDTLKISREALRVRLFRARQLLRDLFEEGKAR